MLQLTDEVSFSNMRRIISWLITHRKALLNAFPGLAYIKLPLFATKMPSS
jgi:hypothetical protein